MGSQARKISGVQNTRSGKIHPRETHTYAHAANAVFCAIFQYYAQYPLPSHLQEAVRVQRYNRPLPYQTALIPFKSNIAAVSGNDLFHSAAFRHDDGFRRSSSGILSED